MTIEAYKNSEDFKRQILAQNQNHVDADQLIQGVGWNNTLKKGCFIGCSINEYNHEKAAKTLGMPIWLMYLCDHIHENLAKTDTAKFFLEFFKNVKTGTTEKEFSELKIKFLHFLLTEILDHQQKKEIQNIINALEKMINGEKISSEKWIELRKVAYIAAGYNTTEAFEASYIADDYNIMTAAYTAYAVIESDYVVDAIMAARANADMSIYQKMAKKLITLVSEC